MSIKRNTVYHIGGALVPLALTLFTVPLYLRAIGEERYGVLALVWLLLGYFNFFDLGLQHATANAIDMAGLTLADGRELRLARDWGGVGPEAAFLRAARDGACRWFGAVLGPDHDAAHADHLHLDMGPWRACR